VIVNILLIAVMTIFAVSALANAYEKSNDGNK